MKVDPEACDVMKSQTRRSGSAALGTNHVLLSIVNERDNKKQVAEQFAALRHNKQTIKGPEHCINYNEFVHWGIKCCQMSQLFHHPTPCSSIAPLEKLFDLQPTTASSGSVSPYLLSFDLSLIDGPSAHVLHAIFSFRRD